MIGTTIKDFKLVERLGKGGWGEVWAAEQPIVRTRVAIKLLRSEVSGDQAHVTRFFNEARAVSNIPHAGIVKIFDVGFVRDQAFLIMELLEGEALSARIRRETRLPLADVIDIARQIASVLGATHEAGVVHRDLKPDNVFLVPDAELGERVKILDFGIAKLSTASVTGTGSLGTPAYMAPEQWNNTATADHRADLYSLGCVLFEMCCGRPPFLATSPGEACSKHLTEQPPRTRDFAPALPVELDELIAGLLLKHADARPTLADVERVLTAASAGAPRVVRRPRASVPPHRNLRDLAGTAETISSASERPSNAAGDATVTSLAGAVIAHSTPPKPSTRRFAMLGGGLAGAAIATAVAIAVTSAGDQAEPLAQQPTPLVEPAFGLATMREYDHPTPALVGNQRSEQVWTGTRDNFATACKQRGAPARWCAAEQFAIGELALIRDDVPLAITAFERAIATDPSWSTGHLGLSNALSYKRDLERSLAAARRAQELDATAWQPAAASARAYIASGKVDDALIEYRRALSMSPPRNTLLIAEVALAYHYAHKDGEADRYLAQASALDDSLISIELVRAERALERSEGAPALVAADRALALSPKNGAALIARGDALVLLGRTDEAIASYRRASELKGGKNILAISEPRLATIEAALAVSKVPPRRGDDSPTKTPPGSGGKPTVAAEPPRRTAPSADPDRSAPSSPTKRSLGSPSPEADAPRAPTDRSPPKPPPPPPLAPGDRAPPTADDPPLRTPPSNKGEKPRSPPRREKPPRTPPNRPNDAAF